MNRSKRIVSRQLIIALGVLASTGLFAQKESKTFQERFIVAEDAVLDVNTSYADIEFETWDKDEVAITATITLEGATKEEAEAYFKNSPIEILGNSHKVTVTSRSGNSRFFINRDSIFNFDISEMDFEMPEIASFVISGPQIAPFPEMPPLPQTEAFDFDYEAYEKDGEKYMKKWQKNFEKSFDKEHQKRLEAWAARMEERSEQWGERMAQQEERRARQLEERAQILEQRIAQQEQKREERRAKQEEIRHMIHASRDSIRLAPNTFYFATDGEQKKYKIKKNINIKLPKATRIKMDVRHGEVKLAANTKNLNANLSHSSLLAFTIEGLDTQVSAAYSPVSVQRWNYGQLSTSYSDQVTLAEVVQLQLQATSSEVNIDKLLKSAFIKNNFGALHIAELGSNFKELDISLKNGELDVQLPKVATDVYIKGNASELTVPASLSLAHTKNGNTTIDKGFHLKAGSGKSIMITSDYSDMVIH